MNTLQKYEYSMYQLCNQTDPLENKLTELGYTK